MLCHAKPLCQMTDLGKHGQSIRPGQSHPFRGACSGLRPSCGGGGDKSGVEISVSESNSWTVENRPLCPNRHPHLNWLVKRNKLTDRPMSIKISSELFPAAGQGSSAALSVAAQLALAESIGLSTNPIDAAITAHQAEAHAQLGRASPTDTATSSLGGCVVVSKDLLGTADPIFQATLDTPEGVMEWDVGAVDLTFDDMPYIVLGHSGAPPKLEKWFRWSQS